MYAAQLDFVGMIYFKFGPDWTDSFLGVADNKKIVNGRTTDG